MCGQIGRGNFPMKVLVSDATEVASGGGDLVLTGIILVPIRGR